MDEESETHKNIIKSPMIIFSEWIIKQKLKCKCTNEEQLEVNRSNGSVQNGKEMNEKIRKRERESESNLHCCIENSKSSWKS